MSDLRSCTNHSNRCLFLTLNLSFIFYTVIQIIHFRWECTYCDAVPRIDCLVEPDCDGSYAAHSQLMTSNDSCLGKCLAANFSALVQVVTMWKKRVRVWRKEKWKGRGRGGPRGSPAHDTSFINRGPQTDGAIPDPHKYVDMIRRQSERANWTYLNWTLNLTELN